MTKREIHEACHKGVKSDIVNTCMAFLKERNFYKKPEYKQGEILDTIKKAKEVFEVEPMPF